MAVTELSGPKDFSSRRDVDDWRVGLSGDLAAARGAMISRLDRGARRAVLTLSLLMVATAAAMVILVASFSAPLSKTYQHW